MNHPYLAILVSVREERNIAADIHLFGPLASNPISKIRSIASCLEPWPLALACSPPRVRSGVRFDFVARLRFDMALAAPLPHDLLRPHRASVRSLAL